MTANAASEQNGERTCPRCGAGFTCGLAARQDRCWCFDFPHVLKAEDTKHEGCLCPTCLKAAIDEKLNAQNVGAGG